MPQQQELPRKQFYVRGDTAEKLEKFARPRRLRIADVIDAAIDALNQLPEKKQKEIIAQGAEPAHA